MVDIGGGIGSVSVILADAYPHLRFVVEDRAPVVAIARQVRILLWSPSCLYFLLLVSHFPHPNRGVFLRIPSPVPHHIPRQSWGNKHADLFSSGRVSYHAHDFLAPRESFEVPGVGTVLQPTVFLLRAVAHNWPDDFVVQCVLSMILILLLSFPL